jgi:hypothetical protein
MVGDMVPDPLHRLPKLLRRDRLLVRHRHLVAWEIGNRRVDLPGGEKVYLSTI